VAVGIALSDHATSPAPVCLASVAVHVITTTVFLGRDSTLWTARHSMDSLPGLEGQAPFILAPSPVPLTATLEAHLLAALAGGLVSAPAGLADDAATVRLRAPFQVLIFAYLDVLYDSHVGRL
jgi:hypothetical protein